MYDQQTLSEKELLEGLSKGDPSVLRGIIALYFPILCKFAEKFLPDSSLAKDVSQETFIKLWNSRQSFDSLNALKGFLFVTTRNGCLNLIRGREREVNRHLEIHRRESSIQPYMTDILLSEKLALIYQFVRSLPGPMQEIFFLSYEEGLTIRQISVRLGMKLKTVKNHKYKMLLHLRRRFGPRYGSLLLLLDLLSK